MAHTAHVNGEEEGRNTEVWEGLGLGIKKHSELIRNMNNKINHMFNEV